MCIRKACPSGGGLPSDQGVRCKEGRQKRAREQEAKARARRWPRRRRAGHMRLVPTLGASSLQKLQMWRLPLHTSYRSHRPTSFITSL